MEREAGEAGGLSFDHEAFGRPQAWTVHDRGLEYAGEVIVSEAVDPAWSLPLEAGVSFRVVFFTVRRRVPSERIQDRRIAMAVPRRPLSEVAQALEGELSSIHEARARYVTSRDRDALALRQSMEDREASVRGELARRYMATYSQGRIYTQPALTILSEDVFVEESPGSWADRMSTAILRRAYPALPLDHSGFPRTLTADEISALFRGLFQGGDDAADVARVFGPGLGLTRRESPALFDAGECPAVAIIQRELESRGNEAPAQEMLSVLADGHGLTRPLAVLYLMAFVRQARAEIELAPGHHVESSLGLPFLGDRITWDLVPGISFTASLAENFRMLRLQPSLTWQTVLPYATLIVGELEAGEDRDIVAAQERRLLDALATMATEMARVREALDSLEANLGHTPSDALDRLQALSASANYQEFHAAALERFLGPTGLREALERYNRLRELAELATDIARTKTYLDGMTFGRNDQELSLERDSLVARIELDSLIRDPSLWSSIREGFQRLRARYANAYVSHHVRYHQDAVNLGRRLERLRPHVEALSRFNDLPELGEAVGTEVPRRFEDVAGSLRTCSVGEEDLSVEVAPYCDDCLLPLDADIPRRDVELLIGAIETAMREYNRRLSSHSVRQVLAHPTKEQLDKFIDLVHVADPSALANVLDDGVVDFLRHFLRSG